MISIFFFKRSFLWQTNLKLIVKQKNTLEESGSCSPGKILKIYMLAVLVLFE